MEETLKTSKEWFDELYPNGEKLVTYPHGWDTLNFHYSYYVAKLTQTDFAARLFGSTLVDGKTGEKQVSSGDFCFAKAELIDGHYYLNKNTGRGMKIGKWDKGKERFICIKPAEFGQYSIYEMPHFEDDKGTVVFEPILNINHILHI